MNRRPKRGYSRAFKPHGPGRNFTIRRIPAGFWQQVQDKARREGVSLRAFILEHLAEWVKEPTSGPLSTEEELTARVAAALRRGHEGVDGRSREARRIPDEERARVATARERN